MSRGLIVLILIVLLIAGALFGLASLDTEREPQLVEKPVADDLLEQ